MAANPFDQFTAPAGNPFDQFDPGAKPAAPSGGMFDDLIPKKPKDGQMKSGFKRSFEEVPGMLAGVGAFAADVVGADETRDSLLGYAKRKQDEVGAAHANDAQSLTDAWDGKVSWGDFLANAAGYVAGQALQSIATGGVGAIGAKMLASNGIKQIGVKVAAEQIASLRYADGKTREIEILTLVNAGHLGGLAADERAGGDLATVLDALQKRHELRLGKLSARVIIQEKERVRTGAEKIVYVHRDEILAQALERVPFECQLCLRAHAVARSYEDRIVVAIHDVLQGITGSERPDA